jgi:UDP-N-acetylglucosamine 4,6-dehydratase/5-epimerase
MPTASAVTLCFEAMRRMVGGEVFILKMPRIRIGDLVEVLIEAYAPLFGFSPRTILVETIGARAGEKRHEALLTEEESLVATGEDGMYVLRTPRLLRADGNAVGGGRSDEPLLDRQQIKEMLDAAGWLRPELIPPV